jgi:hypothetical protein
MMNVTQSFLTTYQTATERAILIKLLKLTATLIELKGLKSPLTKMFIAPFHLNLMMKNNLNYM